MRMTQISSDYAPYSGNKTIIYGVGEQGRNMFQLLERHGISPEGFCVADASLGGVSWEGLPCFSIEEVEQKRKEWKSNGISTVLQMAQDDEEGCAVDFIISAREAWAVLPFFEALKKEKKENSFFFSIETFSDFALLQQKNTLIERMKIEQFSIEHWGEPIILLCMPPKTGDHTLIKTLQKHNVSHHFVFHNPEAISLEELQAAHPQVKIITAVRDPIAENISLVFQIISELSSSLTAHAVLTNTFDLRFFKQGGDVQLFFDLFIQSVREERNFGAPTIQQFIPLFQRHILDSIAQPFDRESGYSILRQGNVDVFVYQLEQLNRVVKPLAHFVGATFSHLEMGNITAEKWVALSYERAKKELKFTEEYVKSSYEKQWISHFYTLKQREEMRKKWENNIGSTQGILLYE